MDTLDKARKKINDIDQAMAKLFVQRMMAVNDVICYKQENNLPILDQNREAEVIQRNLSYITDETLKTYYQQFITEVMSISRSYQALILNHGKIGYQGSDGAFSHLAAKTLFPNFKHTSYLTFETVFQAVINGDIEYGVIPFENSYQGEVGEVVDLFIKYDVAIQKSFDLKVDQNLIGLKGASIYNIKKIYSHPQAIGQSKTFLKALNAEIISYPNTALAAKYVKDLNDPTCAAIAAKETAELYDLEILANSINANKENYTRFFVIGKQRQETGNFISILFTTAHQSGALATIMNIISQFGFNMENIKSRPNHNQAWTYYFYAELDISGNEKQLPAMLNQLQTVCLEFKLLGIYNTYENNHI